MPRPLRRIKTTQEGLQKLKAELEQLTADRPNAVKELTRARELGDLSENGLYTAAKARLRSIDGQLRRLDAQIKLADVVETQKFLVEQDGKQVEYEIVGDYEADPANHKISAFSPIGSQLKGKKTGDVITITTPGGSKTLKILKA